MSIDCRGNPFTEQLPSNSPGIVDVFTDRYLEKGVCLSAYCCIHYPVRGLCTVLSLYATVFPYFRTVCTR
jgi:hypothetical protein